MSSAPGAGALFICATPIGNLKDITLRVLEVLAQVDILACEDTRRTATLLERHGITAKKLLSYHEHNERGRTDHLLGRMRDGESVALVSDAGMPLISDPGYPLVRAALSAGLEVSVLPGPSSVMAALVASGLPAEQFHFAGFLPRQHSELERLITNTPHTLLALQSPKRLVQTLTLLAEHDPSRQMAVCRELTKMHEEVRRASAAQLAAHYTEHPPKGEIVLVIGACVAKAGQMQETLVALRELIAAGARARPAARVLAKLTGLSANELYRELTR